MLSRLVSIPFQQALLARRIQSGLRTVAPHRPARDASSILGRRMIGGMIGKKDMRRPGKIRMERDTMQSPVAAEIGVHPPNAVCRAGDGVDAPQIAGAARDPRRSVGSERQVHGFVYKLRTGDNFDGEAAW